MATSSVDATFPVDNEKVSKAEMRAQFLTIKEELTYLLSRIAIAGNSAFGSASISDVEEAISTYHTRNKTSVARDLAFGRLDL